MLSDRPYMRDHYPQARTSVLTWLICAITAGFVLQNLFWSWPRTDRLGMAFDRAFQLTIEGLKSGHLWTLITYSMLHSMKNFLHIIGNLLALFFLGRELLPLLGSRRFLGLFFGGVLSGAAVWAAANWNYGGAVVGASAGVVALLVVYACIQPNQRISLLLFFIFPITLRPKWIVFTVLLIDGFGFLFYEMLGRNSPFGYAHSAHLGGMAAGWLFFRLVHQREWREPDRVSTVELPRWFRRAKAQAAPAPAFRVNVTPPPTREDLRAEVDRILDKINSQGFGALTEDEKRRLDEAKNLLSRP